MSGGGGGVGGATGTLGGLIALFFVLVAYLSLYLVQEGLGDDLGVETYTNGSGFTTSRSTPKPYFVMWTLHSGYVVWLVALLPGLQTFLFINGMPLLQVRPCAWCERRASEGERESVAAHLCASALTVPSFLHAPRSLSFSRSLSHFLRLSRADPSTQSLSCRSIQLCAPRKRLHVVALACLHR